MYRRRCIMLQTESVRQSTLHNVYTALFLCVKNLSVHYTFCVTDYDSI